MLRVALCAITLLCLVSVARSAPLVCDDLVRPLDQQDLHHLKGRWVLVAGSLKDPAVVDVLKRRDSTTIEIHNSSYTQANHANGTCQYATHNVTQEGNIFTLKASVYNFTVTFFQTSCPDCLLLTLDVAAPNYNSVDFYLFSRRREVDQSEMEEFRAQVECLKMPEHIVMDPTGELCPEQTASEPAAQIEEATEGEKA